MNQKWDEQGKVIFDHNFLFVPKRKQNSEIEKLRGDENGREMKCLRDLCCWKLKN